MGSPKQTKLKDNSPMLDNDCTYGELLSKLPDVSKATTPGLNQLRSSSKVVLHAEAQFGSIDVYGNGFYTYRDETGIAVLPVCRCRNMKEESCTGEMLTTEGADLESLRWIIPLEIAAFSAIDAIINSRENSRITYYLDDPASLNNLRFSTRPEHELLEEQEEEEQQRFQRSREISSEYRRLSSKQKRFLQIVLIRRTTQKNTGISLGIDQSSVSYYLKRIQCRFKRFL